jgi:hypothetical protein
MKPPSLQTPTLEELAGPFVPRPLLGLDAFASPSPPAAVREGGPGEDDRTLGQCDTGLEEQAVLQCRDLTLSNPSSPLLGAARVEDLVEEEVVDEEIVADCNIPNF